MATRTARAEVESSVAVDERDREEASLLLRVRAADVAAFTALVDRLATPVQSLAVAMLGHREEAEEVVQDSLLALYRTADRFDPERGTVRSFVYAIARNQCLDRLRKRRSRPEASDDDPHDPRFARDGRFGSLDGDVVTRVTLEGALAELGEVDRNLIERLYFDGFSHRDLAELVRMPLGTLKTRVRRSLSRLRELLEGS